jgi:hypothetical protein
MKHDYERFRNLPRRSKALHIDRNWEGDSLPDLDPDTLKERHRQKLVGDQIIHFTALFCAEHEGLEEQSRQVDGVSNGKRRDQYRCIHPRGGQFLLLSPGLTKPPQDHDDGYIALGDTLAEAIQELPEALASNRTRFQPYLGLLHFISCGLSPRLLSRVCQQPFLWRSQYEDLRNHYGTAKDNDRREILEDLEESYRKLREALENLLSKLRDQQLERATRGSEFADFDQELTPEEAGELVKESVRILANFTDRWATLDDDRRAVGPPRGFGRLFRPLGEDELNRRLGSLLDRTPISELGDSGAETAGGQGGADADSKEARSES